LNNTNSLYTWCNCIVFKTLTCWRWISGRQFEMRNIGRKFTFIMESASVQHLR